MKVSRNCLEEIRHRVADGVSALCWPWVFVAKHYRNFVSGGIPRQWARTAECPGRPLESIIVRRFHPSQHYHGANRCSHPYTVRRGANHSGCYRLPGEICLTNSQLEEKRTLVVVTYVPVPPNTGL